MAGGRANVDEEAYDARPSGLASMESRADSDIQTGDSSVASVSSRGGFGELALAGVGG
jgi:hypothetical protein